MGLCLYVDLCFHASSLPCLHTFWHAIHTSFYIFNAFLFSCLFTSASNLVSPSMQQSIEKSAKVMINCAGGCWNGHFNISKAVTNIYLTQVQSKVHERNVFFEGEKNPSV